MKLKVFVCAFTNEQLNHIPALPWVVPINLAELPVGELQSNQLCEHRIYFTDMPEQADADYVGFVTWRWFDKFSHLMPISEFDRLPLSENAIWVGEKAVGWYNNTTAIATGSSYSTSSLNNNDSITCVLTSNATCASPTTASSGYIRMTVNVLPVVSIPATGCLPTIQLLNNFKFE